MNNTTKQKALAQTISESLLSLSKSSDVNNPIHIINLDDSIEKLSELQIDPYELAQAKYLTRTLFLLIRKLQ